VIVSDFPEIFAEFGGQRFLLLWRDSRDDFGASDFHRDCDGHADTLTVILDTDGNIFGGFTPVEWESPEKSKYKADPSPTSFLFVLKNPDKVQARKFSLKAEKKRRQSIVLAIAVQALTTLVLRLIAIETTAVILIALAILTPTIPDWTRTRFSRVRSV
jgi:hypothetical protein